MNLVGCLSWLVDDDEEKSSIHNELMCGQVRDTTVMRWNWIGMDYGPSWERFEEKREKIAFTLI